MRVQVPSQLLQVEFGIVRNHVSNFLIVEILSQPNVYNANMCNVGLSSDSMYISYFFHAQSEI